MSASGIKTLSDYKVIQISQNEETLTVEYCIKIYTVIDMAVRILQFQSSILSSACQQFQRFHELHSSIEFPNLRPSGADCLHPVWSELFGCEMSA